MDRDAAAPRRDGSGLELTRACREIAPDTRVLVLSMHDEALFAERALRAGARGYLMKREAIDGLGYAIQEVIAGRDGRDYRSKIKAKLDLKDATDLIRFAATWTERL